MHPDLGMGVEFTQATEQQRADVERFIHALTMARNGALPEILVEPEGLETNSERGTPASCIPKSIGIRPAAPNCNDGCRDVARSSYSSKAFHGHELTPEAFQIETMRTAATSPKAGTHLKPA